MTEVHINHVTAIVAAVINFLVGGLWYSPLLFAKPWMAAAGFTEEDVKKGAGVMPYVIALATALVVSYGMACILSAVQATSIVDALSIGFFTGIAFVVSTIAMHDAFESRPIKLTLINAGHSLVGILVVSVILTIWK
ncbi:DUF1761 domain-containing protein [bacterium]|nr:DUF1761 domain-containing protein [bacterium]